MMVYDKVKDGQTNSRIEVILQFLLKQTQPLSNLTNKRNGLKNLLALTPFEYQSL